MHLHKYKTQVDHFIAKGKKWPGHKQIYFQIIWANLKFHYLKQYQLGEITEKHKYPLNSNNFLFFT